MTTANAESTAMRLREHFLGRAAVGEAGEAVGAGLQLRTLEGAQRADAVAGMHAERGELRDLLGIRRLALGAGDVQHAERAAHEVHRHAGRGDRAAHAP